MTNFHPQAYLPSVSPLARRYLVTNPTIAEPSPTQYISKAEQSSYNQSAAPNGLTPNAIPCVAAVGETWDEEKR